MNLFLCVPTHNATSDAVVAASTQAHCFECSTLVWQAPSTVEAVARDPQNSFLVCLGCAPAILANDMPDIQPLTDQQAAELAEWYQRKGREC